jgi:hypothetical protein
MAKRPAPPVTRGIIDDSKPSTRSKAFWKGFGDGFSKASGYGIAVAVGMVLMYLIYEHPYDRCTVMYADIEDISECVWLLENK